MIDLHCDTISRIKNKKESLKENSGHIDLTRAQAIKQQIQVMALYSGARNIDANLRDILEQIAYFNQEMIFCREQAYPILMAADVGSEMDKIGLLLHLEGAESLGSSTVLLDLMYELGLRSLGLTWNYRNAFADGAYESGGLTVQGRKLIAACNQKGMIVDLAHCCERSALEALAATAAPVMISHANARGILPCFRNVSDQVLAELKANGGIIGVTYVSDFVSDASASLPDLIRHLLYLIERLGVEKVALGSDFDGADDMVITNVADCVQLKTALKRYLSEAEIEQIFHLNAKTFLQAVLK